MVTLNLDKIPTPEALANDRRKLIVDVADRRKNLLTSVSYLLLFAAILCVCSASMSPQPLRDRLYGPILFLVVVQSYVTLRGVFRFFSAHSSFRAFNRIYCNEEN